MMLEVKQLKSYYDKIEALHSINLTVNADEIVALVGSNGAGKTTILNAISGHVRSEGSLLYNGQEILKTKPHHIARQGLLQVPEGRHVFPGLTVEQNLSVGTVIWGGVRLSRGDLTEDYDRVYALFPRLKERRKQLAWSMSGGEQQMLAMGRALMGHPKLLMMDEPSMGLAPLIIDEMFEKIKEINKQGTPMLLVEQNAKRALAISDRAYIIERGRITLEGASKDLIEDERVKEAYLGKSKEPK